MRALGGLTMARLTARRNSCSWRPCSAARRDTSLNLIARHMHATYASLSYNIQRFKEALSWLTAFLAWFRDLRAWKRPWCADVDDIVYGDVVATGCVRGAGGVRSTLCRSFSGLTH